MRRQSTLTNRLNLIAGFTLVEMLVSVSLVLVIMLLLANVFGLAANTVEKQKGTAENDQQVRSFVTIMKGDICSRSFRFVYPFDIAFDMDDANAAYDPTLRRGYFSISENDPDDHRDDVLSFTIDYTLDSAVHSCVDTTEGEFYGRATLLKDPTSTLTDNQYLRANTNQPEFDDGYPVTNDLGRSPYAEVVYFLRNGNLYRRVLLVRKPYEEGTPAPTTPQLAEITGNYPNDAVSGNSYAPLGSGEFNRDFDFAAVYDFANNEPFFPTWGSASGVGYAFSNDNRDTGYYEINIAVKPSLGGGAQQIYNDTPDSLGLPHFRFGHNPQDIHGRAREYTADTTYDLSSGSVNGTFFGRFNLQETAHSDFDYPGSQNGSNNPYSLTDYPTFTLDSTTGLITAFSSETNRRGDDILLSGVLEFDVKVWDDILQKFVDLGHTETTAGGVNGTYHGANNRNTTYGNCYDTWHPGLLTDSPYRPLSVGPDGAPGVEGDNDDSTGMGNSSVPPHVTLPPPDAANPTDDAQELGWLGTDDEDGARLKAIQIQVRFVDPQTSLVRQATFIESLVD